MTTNTNLLTRQEMESAKKVLAQEYPYPGTNFQLETVKTDLGVSTWRCDKFSLLADIKNGQLVGEFSLI